MNKHAFSFLLVFTLLIADLLGGILTVIPASASSGPVQSAVIGSAIAPAASSNSKSNVYISFSKPAPIKMGLAITLSGTIKNTWGDPIVNKSIVFSSGGSYLGQASSDKKGNFLHVIHKILSAGTYTITATSAETHTLNAAGARVALSILPADVQIQTVPAIAGISFELGGQIFLSGEDGMAYIDVNTPGQYRLTIHPELYQNPSLKVVFGRWLAETSNTYQDIQVPYNKVIPVGLNVYQSVGQSFVDLDGFPVSPQRVTALTIRSSQGDVFNFQNGEQHWIPSSRVTRLVDGLQATPLLYSVVSVTVDGANVVNRAQQKFFSHPDGTWPISLGLYSMQFLARDALFGFPVGKAVKVVFPDGVAVNYPLDSNGQIDIHSLARGNYTTSLVGANGISYKTPVALSRSQVVTTKVISVLDLIIVFGLGGALAIGMLVYGRPSMFRSLKRRNKLVPQGAASSTKTTNDSIIKWS